MVNVLPFAAVKQLRQFWWMTATPYPPYKTEPSMFKPLPLFIGLRYIRAKRRNHFISFITLISVFGIALGVMALITVVSVMNGFEKELRARMLSMTPHVFVMSLWDDQIAQQQWQALREQLLEEQPRIKSAAPFIQGQGMLAHQQRVYGTLLQGVVPELEETVSEVEEKINYTLDI